MLENASEEHKTYASHAWCDYIGIPRQLGFEIQGATALARRKIPYPSDLPPMVGQAEILRPDGVQVVVQRYITPGESSQAMRTVVFGATVDAPPSAMADAQNPEVLAGNASTIQAGSFSCDLPAPTQSDPDAFRRVTVSRDRLPAGATNVIWTEGPYSVPARVVAGRDPMPAIIAVGEGG